jgi:hypothetical protein
MPENSKIAWRYSKGGLHAPFFLQDSPTEERRYFNVPVLQPLRSVVFLNVTSIANAAADTVLCLRSIVSTLSRLFGVEHLGKPLDHLGFGRGIGMKGELLGARHVSVLTIGYMQC